MNSGWLALVAESVGVREFLEIYDAKWGSLVHPSRSHVMSGIMGQPHPFCIMGSSGPYACVWHEGQLVTQSHGDLAVYKIAIHSRTTPIG